MNKTDYMNRLKAVMAEFPGHIQEQVLWEYEGKFIDGLVAGRTEEEIAALLPKPELIAAQKRTGEHYRDLKSGFAPRKLSRFFISLMGLAVCNVLVMIPALVYFAFLTTSFVLAIGLYTGGIWVSAAGLSGAEKFAFEIPFHARFSEHRLHRGPVSVELNENGIIVDGKTLGESDAAIAPPAPPVPPPAPAASSATVDAAAADTSKKVQVQLDHRFSAYDFFKGVLMVLAGIALLLLNVVVTTWSWRGFCNYWRWNLRVLQPEMAT